MIGPFTLIEKIGMVIRHTYSFQYLHTLVKNVSQRHHRKYLEDSSFLLNPRSYKRSHYIMTIINQETARIALPKEEEHKWRDGKNSTTKGRRTYVYELHQQYLFSHWSTCSSSFEISLIAAKTEPHVPSQSTLPMWVSKQKKKEVSLKELRISQYFEFQATWIFLEMDPIIS